jgi:hypothetical protein
MKKLYLVFYRVKKQIRANMARSGILENLTVFFFVEFPSCLQTATVDSRINVSPMSANRIHHHAILEQCVQVVYSIPV